MLASIGLTDRNKDGMLEDAAGKPVRFALTTQKGDTLKERTASVIHEQLRQVGIDVDVVAVDRNTVRDRLGKGDYEALYFNIQADAFDPARNLDYWLSTGDFHFWNPNQVKPATTWEAKIDELMGKQASTMDRAERKRLFVEVQRTFADHLPSLYFVAAKATVVMNARLTGATPAVLNPPTLWNSEVLSIGAPTRR